MNDITMIEFDIYGVDYSAPAVIRFRSGEFDYRLTRDKDEVQLYTDHGALTMHYHKIKPIREYIAELLATPVNRIRFKDPMGVQHKSFWEIEL